MAEELINVHPPVSAFRGFLAWVVGLGTCLVIGMATLAFGPSGFGFGVVIAATVFGLMVKRYRFKELSQLTNLLNLGLSNSGITDADLDVLAALPQIGILRLGGNQVSDQAVKSFSDRHPKCKIER